MPTQFQRVVCEFDGVSKPGLAWKRSFVRYVDKMRKSTKVWKQKTALVRCLPQKMRGTSEQNCRQPPCIVRQVKPTTQSERDSTGHESDRNCAKEENPIQVRAEKPLCLLVGVSSLCRHHCRLAETLQERANQAGVRLPTRTSSHPARDKKKKNVPLCADGWLSKGAQGRINAMRQEEKERCQLTQQMWRRYKPPNLSTLSRFDIQAEGHSKPMVSNEGIEA
ncbi:hypothetical protein QBC46DRAFT_407818 [Diplogelasinospora grovesii]|uniref:Uncharacterized protein n=1 Tax=Diplogelasinospora grovesii TaxID=303347 RepID=A0AAN6S584_9PEZI|nr:hypothetical protein QBC46DRAFT_407818 [Diplogelasinospora grovesii]